MYKCEECNGEDEMSKYHTPIVDELGEKKILHIECCSKENLIKLLERKAESELMFYEDIKELINDPNLTKINQFEKKYGTYEEVKNWRHVDRLLEILAVIDQIKKNY